MGRRRRRRHGKGRRRRRRTTTTTTTTGTTTSCLLFIVASPSVAISCACLVRSTRAPKQACVNTGALQLLCKSIRVVLKEGRGNEATSWKPGTWRILFCVFRFWIGWMGGSGQAPPWHGDSVMGAVLLMVASHVMGRLFLASRRIIFFLNKFISWLPFDIRHCAWMLMIVSASFALLVFVRGGPSTFACVASVWGNKPLLGIPEMVTLLRVGVWVCQCMNPSLSFASLAAKILEPRLPFAIFLPLRWAASKTSVSPCASQCTRSARQKNSLSQIKLDVFVILITFAASFGPRSLLYFFRMWNGLNSFFSCYEPVLRCTWCLLMPGTKTMNFHELPSCLDKSWGAILCNGKACSCGPRINIKFQSEPGYNLRPNRS